jgi:DNA-binding protein WhiA
MTFSSKAKSEICRINMKRSCCRLAELAALIHTCGNVQQGRGKKASLKLTTENASIARRIFMLIKDSYQIAPEVLVRRNRRLRKNNSYLLIIPLSEDTNKILEDTCIRMRNINGTMEIQFDISPQLVRKKCCKRSYLRGAFLGGGSVSDPEKAYHIEFVAHSEKYGKALCELINDLGLHAKLIERKSNYVVYLKEGEHIVNLLSLIGAHTAAIK